MSADTHDKDTLGAYALGGIDQAERSILEAHLAICPRCRQELKELEETVAALDQIPPEMFMDGVPEGGDLLLQRTLSMARKATSPQARTRRPWVIAAAAAIIASAAGGVAIGRIQASEDFVSQPPAATASSQPSGTRTGSSTDSATNASMTATLTPAVGWVRVNAAVAGIPAGQRCRLWVVSRDGNRQLAGSWLVSEKGAREGTSLDGSAIVAPSDVAAIEVDNFAGKTFVSLAL